MAVDGAGRRVARPGSPASPGRYAAGQLAEPASSPHQEDLGQAATDAPRGAVCRAGTEPFPLSHIIWRGLIEGWEPGVVRCLAIATGTLGPPDRPPRGALTVDPYPMGRGNRAPLYLWYVRQPIRRICPKMANQIVPNRLTNFRKCASIAFCMRSGARLCWITAS